MRRRRGFGLLEAIVALALLAGTGLALLGWIQQSLQSASRLRDTEQEARLLLSAQALVELINPAEQPSGSLQSNGLTVSWTSQAVEPPKRNAVDEGEAVATWQVGLYRLAVKAVDDARAVNISFVQFRTGLNKLSKAEGAP